jgi:hypothetical protein
MSDASRTSDQHSKGFEQELAKRRRDFDYAASKLKEAQTALDDAEREYGNASRALDALEGCLR